MEQSNNNYKYPDVTNYIHSFWLMGYTGGQVLNGHWGYVEIAPESTADLLVVEFTSLTLLPTFHLN